MRFWIFANRAHRRGRKEPRRALRTHSAFGYVAQGFYPTFVCFTFASLGRSAPSLLTALIVARESIDVASDRPSIIQCTVLVNRSSIQILENYRDGRTECPREPCCFITFNSRSVPPRPAAGAQGPTMDLDVPGPPSTLDGSYFWLTAWPLRSPLRWLHMFR